MIAPYLWQELIPKVEPSLHPLLRACHEFEYFCDSLNYMDLEELKSGVPISNVQILVQRIFAEYFKMYDGEKAENIQRIQRDFKATLSHWFDEKGQWRELTQELQVNYQRKLLHIFVPLFLTPVRGFVQSRIYDSILEAIRNRISLWPQLMTKLDVDDIHEVKQTPHSWMKLSRQLPPQFTPICFKCKRYEEYVEFLNKIHPCFNDRHREKYLKISAELIIESYKVFKQEAIINLPLSDLPALVNFIYHFINRNLNSIRSGISEDFITETKKKAGLYPEISKKKSFGGFVQKKETKENSPGELID